jgi:hypothetical protein
LALAASLALFGATAGASTAEAQHRYWTPRLRFGVSGVGGGFLGDTSGGLGGISPRVGVQLSEHAAILIQGQYLLGRYVDGTGEMAGVALHTAMFELTAAGMFQFGIGPSLDFWWGCDADPGQVVCGNSGPYPGADMRLAIVVGGRYDRTRSRTGFSVSVDLHPTLLDNGHWAMIGLLGFGGEIY